MIETCLKYFKNPIPFSRPY